MILVAGHLELEPQDRDAFVADSVPAVELARGNGPDDGIADRIVEFHLDEYDVVVARRAQQFSAEG